MCLTIPKRFNTKEEAIAFTKKPKIAKKDITVYKSVERLKKGRYSSFYRGFVYVDGYHYYQTKNKFSYEIKDSWSESRYKIVITTGLHSYRDKFNESWDAIVIKCVIPQGSEYYVGENNDYVSSDLIIIGEI